MNLNIIKMTQSDLPRVMEIIAETKAIFKREGIDQWQKGYPNETTIQEDIKNNNGYLIVDEGIVGYFALEFTPDPNYKTLEGAWLSAGPYATIHRFVIDRASRGKGYAKWALAHLETIVLENHVASIRVDTHKNNQGMLKLLETRAYSYCGVVTVADGLRFAFEKILNKEF